MNMFNNRTARILSLVGVLILIAAGTFYLRRDRNDMDQIPTLVSRTGAVTPSTEFLNAQRSVEYYRQQIKEHPGQVKNYVELAELFMQESRVTGNHHLYIPQTQHLIDEALHREPNNYDALVVKGSILMTQHRFDEALPVARLAVAAQPLSSSAYGVLCDALVEMGQYDEAVKVCDTMLKMKPALRVYARASYIRELHGDIAGAAAAMRLASDAGITGEENRAWALTTLGSLYMRDGKLDTAAYLFRGTLDERDSYPFALSGLAQIEAAHGRYDSAISLLSRAYQLAPEHQFVEQLVDVLEASGKQTEANGMTEVVTEAFAKHETNGWNINREYAQFCLNHNVNLEDALKRAHKEYERRPQNIDVLDTYAYALYRTGNANDAVPIITSALRLGTKYPAMAYHAGLIYEKIGDRANAGRFLSLAMQEGLYLHVADYANARSVMASIGNLAALTASSQTGTERQ